MKNLTLILIITVSRFAFTQWSDNSADNTPLDINTKAKELGISTEQLSGILNSASSGNGKEDPLPDALTERFFTGQAAGDNFGVSISSAGDVNGDGYDDVIVGAYLNDANGADAGRAYIYYGGMSMDYVADVVLNGVAAGDHFGKSVSAAGDVNGDGYDDVIVGAPYNDLSFTDAGSAYLFLGRNIMDNNVDLVFSGAAVSDWFGEAVSTAGDVNGDGYSDIIVGAWLNDNIATDAGSAYIFYGGSSPDNNADVFLYGFSIGDFFGRSVSNAGDVNGDGFGDIIVGMPGGDLLSTDYGDAIIFYGSVLMDDIPDLVVSGEALGDYFGFSVSGAGDLNGDGYSDIIVGAYANDGGGTDAGRAYIYLGGAAMDNAADLTLTGETTINFFGYSVSDAGDVNGDGFSDLIVGAYLNSSVGTYQGRAYVYYGNTTLDDTRDIILTGEADSDLFGWSVSSAGDVNGDGYSDLLVGAVSNDAGGTDAGRVYLYVNSLSGSDIPDEFFTGEAENDEFGFSVATAGDVNGDGYPDLIVGAHFYSSSFYRSGRVYIYFSGPSMDNVADLIIDGQNDFLELGYSVSTAGDVNGDGFSDVIIGALNGGSGNEVFIYFGGSSMDNIADIIFTAAAYDDFFGFSVSNAGDVNGDGFSDVIIGAPLNNAGGTDAGRAYIYFGGFIMNNTADVILTGATPNDYFGYSVSSAGDVNGDGYSDVIVGAIFNGVAGPHSGSSYIYFGGASMNNTVDVFMTGSTADDLFGWSVSDAGDLNGDGYFDVIVGARHNDLGGTDAGSAYIFYGGNYMNNIADVILIGEQANDEFGSSVSKAGDVNGDGYSDVIVGAYLNDVAGQGAGRAYIYYGGTGMDNNADIKITGETEINLLGISVSTADDVNRDGYSDVIIGANYAGDNFQGRAYLHLSSSPLIKPRVMSVKDVPFDEGGYVHLKWVRSGYDVVGIDRVTGYVIERSLPPGPSGFAWEEVANVTARKNPFYLYTASTWSDSMTNNSGTVYFRVTAITANPSEFWHSNIMYGHSVDNLAPLPPGAFYAQLNGSNVNLGWQANLEPDFRDYYIYRSDTPVLDDFTLIGSTTDTTFIDNSPISGNAYYYVQAYDVHDNGSALAGDSVMAFLSANIKVLLEGSYDAGGVMRTTLNLQGIIPLTQPFNTGPWNYTGSETVTTVPTNVTDWILVELRSTITTFVDRRAAFLKNDGTLVDLDGASNIKFPTATAGDYYVVIIHRNHLSVMTKDPVTISFSPTLYDMRTDITKAYGTNAMKDLGGGYYGVYTADTDGSGTVNAADRSNTWNQRNLSGYYGTDVDLSGTVNAADRSVVWNNRNISAQVPAPVDGPVTKIVKGGSDD